MTSSKKGDNAPPSPRKPAWKKFGSHGRARSVGESMSQYGRQPAPSPRSSSPPLTLASGSPAGSSKIPISPLDTPPTRKLWEHNFRSFLTRRSNQPQTAFPEVPLMSTLQLQHPVQSQHALGQQGTIDVSGSDSINITDDNSDQSVRGGKFFQSIFGGSGHVKKEHRRKTKSLNELDEPMRNGKDRSYNPTVAAPEHRRVQSQQLVIAEEDDLNMSIRRATSSGTFAGESMSLPTPLQQTQSHAQNLYQHQHLLPPIQSHHQDYQQQRYHAQLQLPQRHDSPSPFASPEGNSYHPPFQLPHAPQSALHPPLYRPQLQPAGISSTDTLHTRFPSSGGSSSHSVSPSSATTEIKKAFTEFHNSSRYARDSTSAFLGDEPSTRNGDAHSSYSMYKPGLVPQNKFGSIVQSRNLSGSIGSGNGYRFMSSSLPTVDENVSINKSMRMLRPFEMVDSWQAGRRYLIGPAALASCPLLQGVTSLSLSKAMKANGTSGGGTKSLEERQSKGHPREHGENEKPEDELVSTIVSSPQELPPLFGCIVLGKALLSYVVQEPIQHHQQRWWSSCLLILRQNYLLEYDQPTGDVLQGLPRGYAHLQYSRSYAHPDFLDALELEFFVSPCAKADKRVLTIRLEETRDKRDSWIACLNRAARLTINDMYEYDVSAELGRGRYATVYAARRRDKRLRGTDENNRKHSECALKIIDKKEFWRRVVKNKERADTIVREASVQATMTTNCSKIPAFVRLRGFLETSDHIALELELLEGMDLFQYVSARGVLPEKEAALVIRDVLTVLDGMNRAGLSHRDIKPANCLVCKAAIEDAPEKADCVVKIADFGMSTFVGVDGLVRGRCGTPGYVAPEIFVAGLHGGYGNKVDVFSAGVTLYVMLCGYEPFYGETDEQLVAGNKAAKFEFPDNDWRNVSLEAKDLVKRMMEPDPRLRLCAKEALKHPWILRYAGTTDTSGVFAHSGVDALGDSLHIRDQTCVIS